MLQGIDVSKWQRTTPSLAGLAFLFARASIGTTKDPLYDKHIAAAKKAGLVTGAYHFNWDADANPATPDSTPEEQARFFVKTAGPVDFLFLDVEGARAFEPDEARRFIAEVHRLGRKVGLYHSRSGFANWGQDYNWVAQWGARAPTGIPWAFWQYQGSPLDRDYFNGDLSALLRLAGKAPPIKASPVPARTIAVLRGYIARLARVARPTAAQRAKLATYRARLVEYLRR